MPSPSSQLLQKWLKGLKEKAGREKGPSPKTRVMCFLLINIAPFCWELPLNQTPGMRLNLRYRTHFSQFWDSKSSSPLYRWGHRGSQSLSNFYFLFLYSPRLITNRCVVKTAGKFLDARQCRLMSGPENTVTPSLTVKKGSVIRVTLQAARNMAHYILPTT